MSLVGSNIIIQNYHNYCKKTSVIYQYINNLQFWQKSMSVVCVAGETNARLWANGVFTVKMADPNLRANLDLIVVHYKNLG